MARDAEVVAALRASHTVSAHVSCSNFIYLFTFIIFVVIVNFSLYNRYGISTLAPDHALVILKHVVEYRQLEFVVFFLPQYVPHLIVSQLGLTVLPRAKDLLWEAGSDSSLQANLAHDMAAFLQEQNLVLLRVPEVGAALDAQ